MAPICQKNTDDIGENWVLTIKHRFWHDNLGHHLQETPDLKLFFYTRTLLFDHRFCQVKATLLAAAGVFAFHYVVPVAQWTGREFSR